MALELLFNAGLLIFLIYSFFYIGNVESEPTPGLLDAVEYPRILLGLLIIFLTINIINILRKRKEGETFKIEFDIKKIVKSKLFIGIVFLFLYVFALDYIGFIAGSIIFFLLYSRLLGEKSIPKLLISAFLSVGILYILFNSMLGIMLPRGTGVFRTFALFLESLI